MAARASKQTPPDEENVWYTATKLDRSDLSPLTRGKPRPSSTRRRALRLISAHTGKTPRLSDRSCHVTAHPRSREENIDAWQLPERHVGSSPLTRGKPSRRKTPTLNTGLIPAHAGKTVASWRIRQAARAHPRSRGENYRPGHCEHRCDGSSPLTRGKRFGVEVAAVGGGLIPAHAGKTPPARAAYLPGRAHPRSRGENASASCAYPSTPGSSPLTRGKRPHERNAEMHIRLIPAHAGKTSCGRSTARAGTAHPRSRGENSRCKRRRCWSAGSSPLTRGKPSWKGPEDLDKRLIPAHAGKTGYQPHVSTPPSAHPRSRGENARYVSPQASSDGSSPLTRGKRNLCVFGHFSCRLIPAHAGKTAIQSAYKHSCSAHPRSRGENDGSRLALRRIVGSSPLTRGKRKLRSRWSSTSRLIPAHAGKTKIAQFSQFSPPAHPRSRGENMSLDHLRAVVRGSSPLTRGKPIWLLSASMHVRLIPAHAGKTCSLPRSHRRVRAHPRSRGENAVKALVNQRLEGSSPLTRGKQDGPNYIAGRLRLIPAHAGKTVSGLGGHFGLPAHPRSRGENLSRVAWMPPTPGSSPLTRGKRPCPSHPGRPSGLIPAHAGKTSQR